MAVYPHYISTDWQAQIENATSFQETFDLLYFSYIGKRIYGVSITAKTTVLNTGEANCKIKGLLVTKLKILRLVLDNQLPYLHFVTLHQIENVEKCHFWMTHLDSMIIYSH